MELYFKIKAALLLIGIVLAVIYLVWIIIEYWNSR